jgi:hypothetical protein
MHSSRTSSPSATASKSCTISSTSSARSSCKSRAHSDRALRSTTRQKSSILSGCSTNETMPLPIPPIPSPSSALVSPNGRTRLSSRPTLEEGRRWRRRRRGCRRQRRRLKRRRWLQISQQEEARQSQGQEASCQGRYVMPGGPAQSGGRRILFIDSRLGVWEGAGASGVPPGHRRHGIARSTHTEAHTQRAHSAHTAHTRRTHSAHTQRAHRVHTARGVEPECGVDGRAEEGGSGRRSAKDGDGEGDGGGWRSVQGRCRRRQRARPIARRAAHRAHSTSTSPRWVRVGLWSGGRGVRANARVVRALRSVPQRRRQG